MVLSPLFPPSEALQMLAPLLKENSQPNVQLRSVIEQALSDMPMR